MKRHLITAFLLTIASGAYAASSHTHWGYSGAVGPANWATLSPEFATCASGKNQSPIDIQKGYQAILDRVEFRYRAGARDIVNNGHTIQVNFEPGSSLVIGKHVYELKQMHFHTPSENRIEGQSFPMEAHLVHTDTQGNIAVVAVLFRTAYWPNDVVGTLWEQMPMKRGQKYRLQEQLSAEDLLPSSKHHYQFNGSLTTPPCSEGVTWILLKQPEDVTESQVEKLLQAVKHANNRPVQPLNARIVVE